MHTLAFQMATFTNSKSAPAHSKLNELTHTANINPHDVDPMDMVADETMQQAMRNHLNLHQLQICWPVYIGVIINVFSYR